MEEHKNRIRRLYVADYLITPDQRVNNGALLCENEKILAVGGISGFNEQENLEIHRFENGYITPGFIDTHIHGAGGFDCSTAVASPNSIASMSKILGERGVTSFFPTVVAAGKENMISNIADLTAAMSVPLCGADPIGINIEGPFINPAKCGAQLPEVLLKIDLGFASELIDAGNGLVKTMTFAPELENSDKLIELLLSKGVIPSMGHSTADEKQSLRAIEVGACHCTHLFNGMPPLHQRNIGLAAISLTDDRVTVELIIDGHHVHSRMVDLTCRCKNMHSIVGISDCTMASGMPDGQYNIGPAVIQVTDGVSRTEGKALAGTTTMLDTGWHSLMSCGHLSETKAAQAVTRNPADAFGFNDRGMLLPGRRADLAVFERGTNRPLMTVRAGEIIYRSSAK